MRRNPRVGGNLGRVFNGVIAVLGDITVPDLDKLLADNGPVIVEIFLPSGEFRMSLDHRNWQHSRTKPALVYKGQQYTYGELDEHVNKLADAFGSDRGPQWKIALVLRNGPDLIFAYLACLRTNTVVVPLNPKLTYFELEKYFLRFDFNCVLTEPDLLRNLRSSLTLYAPERLMTVEGFLRTRHASDFRSGNRFTPTLDSDAVVFYTSGSISQPKGVVYSRRSVINAVKPFFSRDFQSRFDVLPEDFVYAVTASIADTVGILHVLWTLIAGGMLVVLSSFDVSEYLDAIHRYRATHSTLFLPHAVTLLNQRPSKLARRLATLRMLCFAGDKTPTHLISRCMQSVGIQPLIGYGLTESFVVSLNLSTDLSKLGSVGTAVPNVRIRIADSRGNRDRPSGEIIVKSPQTMIKYWRLPRVTRRSFTKEGWFKTGDLGYKDRDGFLWITGRKKQIIIRGGENISPLEIEGVITSHPSVEAAAVVGVEDPMEGQVPRAFVVPKASKRLTVPTLMEFLRRRLVHYKVPTEIQIVDMLPLGRTGKLDRQALLKD